MAALFVIAKNWKQVKHKSLGEWLSKYGISIQWNTRQPFNEAALCALLWCHV